MTRLRLLKADEILYSIFINTKWNIIYETSFMYAIKRKTFGFPSCIEKIRLQASTIEYQFEGL